jgi:hypothetical protein
MGYLSGSLGGDHTSFLCDHDGCSCGAGGSGRLDRDGTHSPVYSIDWLHSQGWELVDSYRLYCPAHIYAGIQEFAAGKRSYYTWEAERDGRKLVEGALRAGNVSEEIKAQVQKLLANVEARVARDVQNEEATRLARLARRAEKKQAAATVDAIMAEVRRR